MNIYDALKRADIAAFKFINITLYNRFVSVLMGFTANDVFLIIVLILGLFLLARNFGPKEKANTAFALWSIIAANILSSFLKELFKRQRPYLEVQGAKLLVVMHKNGYAFPSTHTAMATAIAAALWDDYSPARPYLAAFVFFVGFFCVYTGGHYPSDVAAGFVVGLATGRMMNFMKKEYLRKH